MYVYKYECTYVYFVSAKCMQNMQIARISGLIILKEFLKIRGGKISRITELWKSYEIYLCSVKNLYHCRRYYFQWFLIIVIYNLWNENTTNIRFFSHFLTNRNLFQFVNDIDSLLKIYEQKNLRNRKSQSFITLRCPVRELVRRLLDITLKSV